MSTAPTELYDVVVWPLPLDEGRMLTDLTTGDARRALERRDEILARGRADARIYDLTGRVLVEL